MSPPLAAWVVASAGVAVLDLAGLQFRTNSQKLRTNNRYIVVQLLD
jgi:hypothetical protein